METLEELDDFVANGHKVYLPHLSVECVVFGYENKQLKVLLIKFLNLGWGVPGGYIKRNEGLTLAASRILTERTTLENIFLKQFYIFGDSAHRNSDERREYWDRLSEGNWLAARTMSIGFYALIDCAEAIIKQDIIAEDYKWVDVNEIPNDLLMDHNEIIEKALLALRNQIFHEPIGYNLLPEKFTLPEIQALYETILNKTFDRRNFSNKLLSMGIIVKLDEKRNIGQHRSPYLYRFHQDNYLNALSEGIVHAL
ncbi:NUDIX hydrolase [Flavobacterium daejeonense]|uniref:NUDIX hydrolase n=1 Tax=Flavobacterium daejeonense TaxID=350893 RepID=UPI00047AB316|nr:NUDIX domain-containing protein [Flavobacterium daejeonense]